MVPYGAAMHRNAHGRTAANTDGQWSTPVLTANELAARWRKPAYTIRRWCAKGGFPGAYHIGRNWVIPLSVVRARENGDTINDQENNETITA